MTPTPKPATVVDENGIEVTIAGSDLTPTTPRPKQKPRGAWTPDPGYRVVRKDVP